MANTSDITKLLDQLSGSSAWQQALAAPTSDTLPEPAKEAEGVLHQPGESDPVPPLLRASTSTSTSTSSSRVSELLKLLDTSSSATDPGSNQKEASFRNTSAAAPAATRKRDLRNIHFAEALSLLAGLAQKPVVIQHLIEIRAEQHRLEQEYWESRQRIIKRQEAQIKELKTKVSITGPLGTREIERLKMSFQRELSELEHDDFLPAWDRLLGRQQATLERIGVPLMFETSDPEARRKQQEIVMVLESLMNGSK